MNFHDLKTAISTQFTEMSKHQLFRSQATKDSLWETYLGSFPEGTNPIYLERTEHDCNCCKQFIRAAGGVLAIIDGKLVSIWDIEINNQYQVVVDAMSKLVKEAGISNIYLHTEKIVGTDQSIQFDNPSIVWKHFHHVLPSSAVWSAPNIESISSRLGIVNNNFNVLKRSLEEITTDSIEIVIELIDQNSLYRGEEHASILTHLLSIKSEYDFSVNKEFFIWEKSLELGNISNFHNTVIGTLLCDISDGLELEVAVKKFELKVAPQNYKRSSAIVTKGMITQAQDKVAELGIESALSRRYAITTDVTINNVLFADRSVQADMGVFGELLKSTGTKLPNLDKIEEVSIADFLENILPKAEKLEVFVSNTHAGNLMSLVAPIHSDAKSILRWNNNFTWSYTGEVTDSISENVKRAGGNIAGCLRFSIQWNDKDNNKNDLDAHCIEPAGNIIYFSHPKSISSGILDVDIQHPNGVAVENIVFTHTHKMNDGIYIFKIHNYTERGGRDWSAEIAFGGKILSFNHIGKCENMVTVAIIRKTGSVFEFISGMDSSETIKEVWGIHTQKFQEVNMVMNSPNHWDGEKTGNKHIFFILKDCVNPEKTRGFYNEFLKQELSPHRKVFEVLSSQMKTEKSDTQLSGLGFSTTQRNHVLCKVSGSFNRIIKINF